MNYKIIETDNIVELEQIITEHLRCGWECQGGVCVTVSGGVYYTQAIVRRK